MPQWLLCRTTLYYNLLQQLHAFDNYLVALNQSLTILKQPNGFTKTSISHIIPRSAGMRTMIGRSNSYAGSSRPIWDRLRWPIKGHVIPWRSKRCHSLARYSWIPREHGSSRSEYHLQKSSIPRALLFNLFRSDSIRHDPLQLLLCRKQ